MICYWNCRHGIYLCGCRKCFPLPKFKESERKMKHKWDKEIRAYLDGKEVEMYYPDVKEWKQVLCMSKFDCKFDIRIKPETKPDFDGIVIMQCVFDDKVFTVKHKIIFDGDTGKPKSSEVVK